MSNIGDWIERELAEQDRLMKELGECEGYLDLNCPNCNRHRVIHYTGGKDICEKCEWCIQDDDYFTFPYAIF